jgi:hypothetical protein
MKNVDYLAQLQVKGINFSITYENEIGRSTLALSASEVELYLSKPNLVIAKKLGVTEYQYNLWQSEEFNVRCSATTNSGDRCMNIVKNGSMVPLERWLTLYGDYCHTHEWGHD